MEETSRQGRRYDSSNAAPIGSLNMYTVKLDTEPAR